MCSLTQPRPSSSVAASPAAASPITWPALGWTDVVAHRAARTDRGHHLALGRLRRPAPLDDQPDPDDHVLVEPVRASCANVPAWTRAGAASAGCAWRPRPSGSRSCAARQSAATTYGLELDLLTAGRDGRAAAAARRRRRAGRGLAARRRLRSSPRRWPRRSPPGRPRSACTILTGVRVTGIEVVDGRVPAYAPTGADRDRDVVVDAAGAAAGQRRPARRGWTSRSCRSATSTWSRSRSRPADPRWTSRRSATRTTSSTSGRPTRTGCWSAGTSAIRTSRGRRRRPRCPTRARCSTPNLAKFAESWGNARRRVPALRSSNRPGRARPGGVHPRRRVPARRDRGGRASGSRPGSACTGWPRRAASARSSPSGSSTARRSSTSPRWTSAASARTPRAGPGPRAKALDAYSRYYDIVYPVQEWTAGRPLRRSPVWPRLAELDAVLGEKAGWERVNWFDTNATTATRRDRPAGWAGPLLVAGDRRRVPRHHRRRRPVRPVVVREARRARPGRRRPAQPAVRQRHRPSTRHDRLHPAAQRTRRASRPT